jgi:hypothetical protein
MILAFLTLASELHVTNEKDLILEETYIKFISNNNGGELEDLQSTNNDSKFFNITVFKSRIKISLEIFLSEANLRGKLYVLIIDNHTNV